MVISQDIIFIHIAKTGGMSCADFLLKNLRSPIYNCYTPLVKKPKQGMLPGVTIVADVGRHIPLRKARPHVQRLTGKSIEEMGKILAIIRHPFTLEYSYFRHLQRPQIAKRRQKGSSELVKLAQGDFKTFVAKAGHLRPGGTQEDYFLIDGERPDNLQLIRFEELSNTFPEAVKDYLVAGRDAQFPMLNASGPSTELQSLLDEETRELIYHKHRYMFDKGYYSTDWP